MSNTRRITRAHMTEAMARFLAVHGLSSSIESMVAHSGAARMTAYNEFHHKQEMLAEAIRYGHGNVVRALKEVAAAEDVYGGSRRLELAFGELVRLLGDPDSAARLVPAAVVEFPVPEHALHRLARGLLAEQSELLEAMAGEAGADDPAGLAAQLVALAGAAVVVDEGTRGTLTTTARGVIALATRETADADMALVS